MKVGSRLYNERNERKLNQAEMAELLGVSTSAYARLERGETSAEMEQLAFFAKKLDIPFNDLLPENIKVENKENTSGQVGFVMGNFYSYGEAKTGEELEKVKLENTHLKEKNELLQKRIEDLEALVAALKEK